AEAAGHDRVADEVAGEEPQVRPDVELGADEALVEGAAFLADRGDAVEHQHGRRGKLGVARAEQLAARAGQQILVIVARLSLGHVFLYPLRRRASRLRPPWPFFPVSPITDGFGLETTGAQIARPAQGHCAAIDRIFATEYMLARCGMAESRRRPRENGKGSAAT